QRRRARRDREVARGAAPPRRGARDDPHARVQEPRERRAQVLLLAVERDDDLDFDALLRERAPHGLEAPRGSAARRDRDRDAPLAHFGPGAGVVATSKPSQRPPFQRRSITVTWSAPCGSVMRSARSPGAFPGVAFTSSVPRSAFGFFTSRNTRRPSSLWGSASVYQANTVS